MGFHQQYHNAGPGKWFQPIHDWLNKESRILDWGCGQGHMLRLLQQQGFHIEGYDISHRDHQQLPTGVFDQIYSMDVWEHQLPNQLDQVWQQIETWSRPGTRHMHVIDCTPANKWREDLSNEHSTLWPPRRWRDWFQRRLRSVQYQPHQSACDNYITRTRVIIQGTH